jgi:hypothetical protein
MSSPILRELFETAKRAGHLTQKLVSQNAQHLGQTYRYWGPKDPMKAYMLCGVPVGLYTGHSIYKSKLKEVKDNHYPPQSLTLGNHLGASFAGTFVGAFCGLLWPVALPASIGYAFSKEPAKSRY